MVRTRIHSNQAGFTLIEILIASSIVAVIAAIAVVGYRGYVETAKVNIAINDLTEMSIAISDYGLDNGKFPASLAELGLGAKRDPWGNPYQYLNI